MALQPTRNGTLPRLPGHGLRPFLARQPRQRAAAVV
jgi:hypothetical protein